MPTAYQFSIVEYIKFSSVFVPFSTPALFLSHTFPLLFLTPLIFLSTCFHIKRRACMCMCVRLWKTRFSSLFSVNPFVYSHVYADCHQKGPHTIWFFFDLIALHRSARKKREKGKCLMKCSMAVKHLRNICFVQLTLTAKYMYCICTSWFIDNIFRSLLLHISWNR